MASSKLRTPTYHVSPHFNITATGGPLQLGIVVQDLFELVPLNRKEVDRIPIPDEEIYRPSIQTGFHATRSQLLSGQFGVWAKVLGLNGIGGNVSGRGEHSNNETFQCDSVVTTYFDPTDEWVAKCLAVKSVDDYIVGSGYKKEVYLITGLKVAKNLSFDNEVVRKPKAEGKVEASAPQVPLGVGVEGNATKEKSQTLGFQSDDIVVGFRVRKYRYKKKSLSSKERKLEGVPFVKGAEMLDDKIEPSQNRLDRFEEVPINEEVSVRDEVEKQEGYVEECWVNSTPSITVK
ncbi:MAG: hypothetical protein M1822_005745 [Bathelium mastoideum]|nr:MAG: hypothetical protein M1822_005745 [Bathelium mastoideum]